MHSWPWNRTNILDYPSGHNVIIGTLKSKKLSPADDRKRHQRESKYQEELTGLCWLWRWREPISRNVHEQPMVNGHQGIKDFSPTTPRNWIQSTSLRNLEADLLQGPQIGIQAVWPLDFNLVKAKTENLAKPMGLLTHTLWNNKLF